MAGSKIQPGSMSQLWSAFCTGSRRHPRAHLQGTAKESNSARRLRSESERWRRLWRWKHIKLGEAGTSERTTGETRSDAEVRVLLHLRSSVYRRIAADPRATVSAEVGSAEQLAPKVRAKASAQETAGSRWCCSRTNVQGGAAGGSVAGSEGKPCAVSELWTTICARPRRCAREDLQTIEEAVRSTRR